MRIENCFDVLQFWQVQTKAATHRRSSFCFKILGLEMLFKIPFWSGCMHKVKLLWDCYEYEKLDASVLTELKFPVWLHPTCSLWCCGAVVQGRVGLCLCTAHCLGNTLCCHQLYVIENRSNYTPILMHELTLFKTRLLCRERFHERSACCTKFRGSSRQPSPCQTGACRVNKATHEGYKVDSWDMSYAGQDTCVFKGEWEE